MSGDMDHPVDQVIVQALVDNTLGTLPSADDTWPIFYDHLPDSPDDAVLVSPTESVIQSKSMIDGELQERLGVQILVRGDKGAESFNKTQALAINLDQLVRQTVTIDTTDYLIHSFRRTSGILKLGPDKEDGRRKLFSFNGTVSVTKTS